MPHESIYQLSKAQSRDGVSETALGPFLYSLVLITRAQRALEVGTGHGFGALAMALAMRDMWEGFPTRQQHLDCRPERKGLPIMPAQRPKVVTIEQPGVIHTEVRSEIDRLGLGDYIDQVYSDCFAIAPSLGDRVWDIAFLDATKSAEEIIAYLPLLRAEGFMVLHDYFGSGNGPHCANLDRSPSLEGMVCDTGFMSWKVYRIKERMTHEQVRALFR